GELQRRAGELFPERVGLSPFRLWSPGQPIPAKGRRILIGVAARYSLQDLELLDKLSERVEGARSPEVIDVFDASSIPRPEEFQAYVPGLTRVLQTPVLGVWDNGTFVRSATGWEAVMALQDMFRD